MWVCSLKKKQFGELRLGCWDIVSFYNLGWHRIQSLPRLAPNSQKFSSLSQSSAEHTGKSHNTRQTSCFNPTRSCFYCSKIFPFLSSNFSIYAELSVWNLAFPPIFKSCWMHMRRNYKSYCLSLMSDISSLAPLSIVECTQNYFASLMTSLTTKKEKKNKTKKASQRFEDIFSSSNHLNLHS